MLSDNNYPKRLQQLLSQGKFSQALIEIEKSISSDGGLFATDSVTMEQRRTLWMIRIDILQRLGRPAEALAWICLECELNPGNITAVALKKQLIERLNLKGTATFETKFNNTPKDNSWANVAGMRTLTTFLESELVLPLLERKLYESYKISVPNGVLFYGPPGCGKTFISKRLSERLKRFFIVTKPSDFASEYIHGTQKKIREWFEYAASKAPCVLLLDELDALIPKRNATSHSYASEVNEFLTHLDRAASKGVLVVGTTNYLDRIDEAAIRPGRFDLKVFVGPPDFEARVAAFKYYMKDRPQDFIDWELIADATEGRTYADIKFTVDAASKKALETKKPIGMAVFYELLNLANL